MNQKTILIHSVSDSIILVSLSPAIHSQIILCSPKIYNALTELTILARILYVSKYWIEAYVLLNCLPGVADISTWTIHYA